MRVHPDAGEAFWWQARIDTGIEVIGHGRIVEQHCCPRTALTDKLHVFDEQQVVCRGDAEAADFRRSCVAKEQQLGPRIRREAESGA